MAMQTGENEQAMRKILDMTRLISIVILVIHFYYYSYAAFQEWGLSSTLSDRLLGNIYRTGLFEGFHKSKLIALGFLFISLLGSRGRKDEKLNHKTAFAYIITGLLIYFTSYLALLVKIKTTELAVSYIGITSIGVHCYRELSVTSSTIKTFLIGRMKRFHRKNAFWKTNIPSTCLPDTILKIRCVIAGSTLLTLSWSNGVGDTRFR